jgi:flagellar hook-associated protein 3 FlgL
MTNAVNRVATNTMTNQANRLLQTNQSRLTQLQNIVSSGKKINRPSDNPLSTTQLLQITQTLKQDEQFLKNISSGLSELQSSITALDQATELINRAMELSTQASTFTTSADNMQAIATEFDLLTTQLVQLGNSNLGGRYLFGGMRTAQPPFERTGDTVGYTGNLTSENNERALEVGPGQTVAVNLTGDEIFGSVTSAGTPPAVTGGSGLIHTMMLMKQAMVGGDKAALRSHMDTLTQDQSTVLNAQARLGSINNRLELTYNRLESRNTVLSQQYSDLQEIDLAELISDLRLQEQVTQTSMGVIGRVITPSLLTYL